MFCATEVPVGTVFKTCKCGRQFTANDWLDLAFVGLMDSHNDYEMLALRNCPCRSTLATEVPLCVDARVGLSSFSGLQALLAARLPTPTPPVVLFLVREDGNG